MIVSDAKVVTMFLVASYFFFMPLFLNEGALWWTTYMILSSLQKVVGGLHDNHNIPTLLQSLGLILEYSPSMYTSYDDQFINFVQRVFVSPEVGNIYFSSDIWTKT